MKDDELDHGRICSILTPFMTQREPRDAEDIVQTFGSIICFATCMALPLKLPPRRLVITFSFYIARLSRSSTGSLHPQRSSLSALSLDIDYAAMAMRDAPEWFDPNDLPQGVRERCKPHRGTPIDKKESPSELTADRNSSAMTSMEQPCSPPSEEDATIEIYIPGCPTPHLALAEICACRSGWMAAKLRSKDGQNQKVVLKGVHKKAADALIQFFQLDSTAIQALKATDKRVLIDMFQLHELKREMEDLEQEYIGRSCQETYAKTILDAASYNNIIYKMLEKGCTSDMLHAAAVSYTHLTLPTILRV